MNLVSILVALLRAGLPFPDWRNREQFLVWWGGLGPVAFDILAALTPDEVQAVCGAVPSDDLWESVAAELYGDAPGRIGDGTILRWLQANGPALLQLIMTIIAIIPKKPDPAPAPQPAPLTT